MEKTHPWSARLIVSGAMLVFAFIGMVVTDVKSVQSFSYWKWVVPVFAIMALGLSWYIRRKQEVFSPVTLGHEFLHWAGVVGAVFVVSYFVSLGLISRFIEGLFDLILLSLGVFLAGVYIEKTFLFVGIILSIMAILSAAAVQYIYAFTVPLFLGAIFIVVLMIWISKKKRKDQE